MESGTPPDRPSNQPGSDPPEGPPSPPPGPPNPGPGPQSPGPQSPEPGPQSPAPPAPPGGPQSPQPWAPPGEAQPGPEGVPGPGQMPPGGWQTPMQQQGWVGAPLSGWWSRVGAALLDGLILLIPVIVLAVIIIGIAAGSEAGAVVTAILGFLAYFIASLFYAPVLMARGGERNGQTFGKQALGIQVTRDTGQPFDLGSAFIRELVVKNLLFGFVGSFFFSIPTLLNYLWPLWDDQNRALHDMVVKTHVVKT